MANARCHHGEHTLAVQEGRGQIEKVEFVVRRGATRKKAKSFITPDDGKGFYWLQAGSMIEKRALFLSQIEKTPAGGAFGFKQIGQWLGIVDNPLDKPLQWRIKQHKLELRPVLAKRTLTWGSAVMVDGDYLYIYGIDEDPQAQWTRSLPHSRSRSSQSASDVKAWRYYARVSGRRTIAKPAAFPARWPAGFSHLHPGAKHYVLVYTQAGLSDKIRVRTALSPGPVVGTSYGLPVPDISWDKRIFCYAAKAMANRPRPMN